MSEGPSEYIGLQLHGVHPGRVWLTVPGKPLTLGEGLKFALEPGDQASIFKNECLHSSSRRMLARLLGLTGVLSVAPCGNRFSIWVSDPKKWEALLPLVVEIIREERGRELPLRFQEPAPGVVRQGPGRPNRTQSPVDRLRTLIEESGLLAPTPAAS
jgi:hypothetical protein